eukprot:CAMPEP_0197902460 /NCGR_PEP_ID=MMETSP1439-20131203/53505_1 /TAXON_ID=66791 /ORGANISM="Gonyaulax spinifera, Strain CCMP409" /LENGTH=88 /DNA_ID=CAMNT_0043523487 /DNA_START=13 /DNA_END=275 /DNA_ORIENTATION=-
MILVDRAGAPLGAPGRGRGKRLPPSGGRTYLPPAAAASAAFAPSRAVVAPLAPGWRLKIGCPAGIRSQGITRCAAAAGAIILVRPLTA